MLVIYFHLSRGEQTSHVPIRIRILTQILTYLHIHLYRKKKLYMTCLLRCPIPFRIRDVRSSRGLLSLSIRGVACAVRLLRCIYTVLAIGFMS